MVMTGLLLTSCGTVSNLIMGSSDVDLKLYEGIIVNNMEEIKEALEDGANINEIKGRLPSDTIPVWIATKHAMSPRILEYLINRGADVNIPKADGISLLGFWANNTDVNFCELLIKHGAKADYENKTGYTPLEYVLDYNNRATGTEKNIDTIVTMLLENGAKIRPESLQAALYGVYGPLSKTTYRVKKRILEGLLQAGYKSGLDPELEAALLGDSSRLNTLIKAGKMKKENEEQILFSTAAFGSVETMKLLKNSGIDLAFRDKYGYTPLIVASYYGNLDMVKYLVNDDVDMEIRIITGGDSHKSALYFAVEKDQYDVAEYLIKKGADIKPFALDVGFSDVFGPAIDNGNIKMIKLILDNGYPLDISMIDSVVGRALGSKHFEVLKYFTDNAKKYNYKGFDYTSPLKDFSLSGKLEIIKFLIENGAKVDGYKGEGDPIRVASEYGYTDVVDYLIKHGANVNAGGISTEGKNVGKKSESALRRAIPRGNFAIIKLLIDNGADLEQLYEFSDGTSTTALISAAGNGSTHILEYLVKKGADVNRQNLNGETSLMRAAANNRIDNVKLLIANKADKNLKNNEGHTALDLAKAKKRKDVIKFLENTN